MPDYRELITFIPGPKTALPAVVQRYRHALAHLGLLTEDLSGWLAGVDWEPDEDRFGFTVPPVELRRATTTLQVRPMMWYDPTDSLEVGGWYQVGLFFETKELADPTMYPGLEMRPAPAMVIWQAMLAFAQAFPTQVIYFFGFAMELVLLRQLETQQGDPWLFDLAIIPSRLVPPFGPIPSRYRTQEIVEGLAVAESEMWPVLPWRTEAPP